MPHHKHAHHLREREVHHVRNAQRQVVDTANVVSVVYVTASKTFDGPVGGYKTLDDFSQKADSNPQQQQTPGPMLVEPTTAAEVKLEPSISPEVQSKPEFRASLNAPAIRNSQDPTTTATPETSSTLASTPASTFVLASLSLSTSIAVESSETRVGTEVHPTSASSAILGVPLATSVVHEFPAANSGLSTPTADASAKSQGMSGAAKAGLAIGLILIIGVAAACVFFFLRRRKGRNESYQKTDDEKTLTHNRGSLARTPSTRSTRTTATAPRLSLRPVTQFLPDLASRSKTANASAPSGGSARSMPDVQGQDLSEKNINSNQSNNSVDPFGDRAEVSDGITLPIQSNTLVNPFGNHAATADHGSSDSMSLPVEAPAPLRVRTPTPETTRAGSDAATSPIGTARDERYKSPNQVNITQLQSGSPAANALPSPTGTEFSTSSASAVPNTHGSSPANVHRVQLDFKPSMDDELELQAGQLVRLLHEYDDGWVSLVSLSIPSIADYIIRLSVSDLTDLSRVLPLVLASQPGPSSLAQTAAVEVLL